MNPDRNESDGAPVTTVSPTQRVWFPLRSNIGYFETTGPSLDLESRVKEMALLAEEILFEPGVLDVTVADSGLMSFWHPPGTFDEEHLRQRREGAQRGQPIYFGVAKQAGLGQPAPAPTLGLISGPLQQGFLAEYELSLREWGLDDLPWVRVVWLKQEGQRIAEELSREERRGWPGRDAPRLSENDFLNDTLKNDLARDLCWGAVMGVPVAVDELHAPMLEYKTGLPVSRFEGKTTPGSAALRIWIPDFSRLPWSEVIALHDHDAIGAFRQKLMEAEEAVADRPEEEWGTGLRDFYLEELAQKIADLVPSAGRVGLEVGAGLVFDVLTQSIPFIGAAASAIQSVAEYQREQGEWTAVLISLVKRTARTANTPCPKAGE